ncbi:MAG: type II secretion system ATPase GspE [Magnetococcales bacterium]|nr:type II secretion system ATPase GspE [Magnetococcales bacterium]
MPTDPVPAVLESPPPPPAEVSRSLGFAFCRKAGVLITGESAKGTVAVLCRPGVGLETVAELRRHLGRPLKLRPVSDQAFEEALRQEYELGSSRAMREMEELDGDLDLSAVARQLGEPKDLVESADDAPIIRLINALFTEAVKRNASDIHLEPYEDILSVRFRIDGVLNKILEPKRVLAPLIASRVKVMARLDIAEKRLPQDGRISLRIAGRPVDVRVSTIPTGHGERVVMRLLDKRAGLLSLEELGMTGAAVAVIDQTIRKPNGIILVTGPTGSGKTTTLYAMLQRLNDHSRNIMTVEDPIEYNLEGISQTHVNTKVDLTFARGLRAILRQDPDVVMVGEIRDLETARIAVQASLTGHLVLSTLHTNSAIGAITRLRDMGVESYLAASSLLAVLAQRLVRVLCPACKRSRPATSEERAALGLANEELDTLWEPRGCDTCAGTGYAGRTGVYELLVMDEKLRVRVHDGAGEQELTALARGNAYSLRADGLRLVKAGVTSLEEVVRVTRED